MEKPKKLGGRVEKERVRKAVEALLKWEGSRKKVGGRRELLFDEEEDELLLYLVVALKRLPERAITNPFQIPIPHPLFSNADQQICLFINDRKGLRHKEAKQKLAEEKIPIAKVIALSKLKSDYVAFDAKRKLCGSYHLFLADKAVLPSLPNLLGKTFFKKKKHPIPVDLTKKDWRAQIESACSSTFFYIKGGTCSVLKVGLLSQTNEEIVENVCAAIDGVASVVPKKWKNIRAFHLKSLSSVALPLYQSGPDTPLKIDASKGNLNSKTQ